MRAAPVFCLLAAAACAEPAQTLPVNGGTPAPPPDTCGAAAYSPLIGQDIALFAAAGRTGPFRIIRPGQPVTMDFNPERLNVLVDDSDRIAGVSCG